MTNLSLNPLLLSAKLEKLVELNMYFMTCEFVLVLSVLKIIVFSFVSYIIEIDRMSAVKCYNRLIEQKDSDAPLSKAAKCKLIVDHILCTYDLVLDKNHENLLKTDSIPLSLTYHHITPVLRDRFKFYLTLSFEDDDEVFSIFLKVNIMPRMCAPVYVREQWCDPVRCIFQRKRVVTTQQAKKSRYNAPVGDAVIDYELIPSLLDDEQENDLARLMKAIGNVVQRLHKT